jgi:hypothetical protein
VCECDPQKEKIDLTLLEHVSPIEWDNVLLYGRYVIDRSLIHTAKRCFCPFATGRPGPSRWTRNLIHEGHPWW